MGDPYLQPELAIACFEGWSGLSVAVHDLRGRLAPYLSVPRQRHVASLCAAIKRSAHGAKCIAFEAHRVHADAALFLDGRIQICHAGLVEAVMPVTRGGQVELVLFAGQRTAAPDLQVVADPQEPTRLPIGTPRPPAMTPAQAEQALEGLRQLGARLRLWLDESGGMDVAARLPAPSDRRSQVLRFIAERHHEAIALADLAAHLGVGRHRTAHVVKALFATTFVALVTEARLRSACAMLAHTTLTIPDLARRAGFNDPDHFHRVFRRALHMTPGRYRLERTRREA